ncbi:MAG TPA: hypothetical protein VFL61_03280 [Gaiellaceae bacterium]|nr:hypothetical protein [Gaiellaceae bacterium]
MTGDQALAELLDVSEDVVAAVILDAEGRPVAAGVSDEDAHRVAEIALATLAYADALRTGPEATRIQAVTAEGSVFVVRAEAGAVVAATGRDPVAGLVYHDLRATLRKLGRRRQKARAAS